MENSPDKSAGIAARMLDRLGADSHLIDPKFARNQRRYIYQCCAVSLTMIVVLLLLDMAYQPVLIAALGSSSMAAFAAPNMRASRPRCLIGGYLVGVFIGCSISFLVDVTAGLNVFDEHFVRILAGAVATGLAMFVMVTTDTEHPPAAALALGFVLNEWNLMTVIAVMSGITMIVLIKEAFRGRLVDLL
jgi:CBS domain-containing membrane protein